MVLLALAVATLAFEWVRLPFTTDPAQRYWLGVVFPLIVGSALACLLVAYGLGRTGHTMPSGLMVVFVALASSYAMVLLTRSSDGLSFFVLGVVLSSILLSWRLTLGVLALIVSATLAVPLFVPEIPHWSIWGALFFVVPVGALSLVSAIIHGRDLEQIHEQTRALVENQEKILGARKTEAIARLSAGIAHEFNNIAMAIVGYSDVIASKPAQSARQYCGFIKEAGLRAGRLTEQLLSFSRQQLLHPRATDLNELIAGLEQLLRSMTGEKIRLIVRLDPAPKVAHVDPDLIGQVVTTLLAKATNNVCTGGVITIGTAEVSVLKEDAPPASRPGRYWAITISDTGPSVQREMLARVFDPFFTEGDFGTGDLDLAAAYGIVAQSGGRMDATSDPEHGNTFAVLLPQQEGS